MQKELLSLSNTNTETFRDALRKVVGMVSIVATGQGASRRGLTVTAANSLTVEPPMVVMCINRSADAHDTILSTGSFSWNVLSIEHIELARRFAGMDGRKGESKFSANEWTELVTRSPVLIDSLCSFDCHVETASQTGTHTIITGAVVAQTLSRHVAPLIYAQGRFGTIDYNVE
ncbi:flavin reductase family protein [Alloalcanivorax sp. C16-1]|uniref:flavin reductase family protein n=1 Tax=Alloalcanivorax sp. C16-1 TaxID=3390051 RepID=UPI0039704EA7